MYAKRFAVTGIIRDRWYDLTKGTPGSQVYWLTANPNGEAETVKVYLRPRPGLKRLILDYDFSQLAIKGRASMGNIVTKYPVQKVLLRAAGVSTIGGKQMWFDRDIDRLNEDGRGELLGEFRGDEHILAVCKDGTFYTRFQGDLLIVEKFAPSKVYTAIYWDKVSGYYYIKRFCFELSDNTTQNFIPVDEGARLVAVSEDRWPSVHVEFVPSGNTAGRPSTSSSSPLATSPRNRLILTQRNLSPSRASAPRARGRGRRSPPSPSESPCRRRSPRTMLRTGTMPGMRRIFPQGRIPTTSKV